MDGAHEGLNRPIEIGSVELTLLVGVWSSFGQPESMPGALSDQLPEPVGVRLVPGLNRVLVLAGPQEMLEGITLGQTILGSDARRLGFLGPGVGPEDLGDLSNGVADLFGHGRPVLTEDRLGPHEPVAVGRPGSSLPVLGAGQLVGCSGVVDAPPGPFVGPDQLQSVLEPVQ